MHFPRPHMDKALTYRLLVVCCIVFGGCNSSNSPPSLETVALQYVERSDRHFEFLLSNGASQSLTIVGWPGITGSIALSRAAHGLECNSISSSSRTVGGFAIVEDASPRKIRIAPGEARRLLVPTAYFLPFRGDECRLLLRFENNAELKSTVFVP